MTVRVFIQMSWLQRNLSWNPSEYLAIDRIKLETNSIWLPNIIILSGEKGGQKIEFPDIAQLHSDGNITLSTTTYVTFRCDIDFDKYPFDSQECHFGFYFDDVNPPHIDVVPWNASAEFKSDSYAVTGEWYILDFSTELFTDFNNESWPRYHFKVKRRSTYYVITVVFPLILTSAMIPLVFLMPPENGEKVSYLVAVFTSTAIFLNFIR
ncbi:unnamed protein product [Lymnaea stagnalis]|uniref:Neurotransmitter-gated ion-channel ligand-binding domain-containing protein n=1 Tax=Lymnaea stagnalis TaxID=6523 RepID=A0AAV2HZF0_LYMST